MSEPLIKMSAAAFQQQTEKAGAFIQEATARLEKSAAAADSRAEHATKVATHLTAAGLLRAEDQAGFAANFASGDGAKLASLFVHVANAAKAASAQRPAVQNGAAKTAGFSKSAAETSSEFFTRKFGS